MQNTTHSSPWWETGIVYQIYPRSFQDSNADGVGDLQGILTRLPYLRELGVTALWLSPIYPSPMVDFGYDISDYTAIHPLFGALSDFDRLAQAVHEQGLKLILDFVPNHTSDQHPWFVESRASRTNAKRDWYIWRDAQPDGRPPNNWVSYFGGGAWAWDESTQQYYLHTFAKEQPDLNWRNPAVVSAMLEVLRFWLKRGVDGFRVDVISLLMKDAGFRDDTPNPDWTPAQPVVASTQHDRSEDQPEVHGLIRQMRRLLDEHGAHVLIGEVLYGGSYQRLMKYYGVNADECHQPFNFGLIGVPFTAAAIRQLVQKYESLLPPNAWPNWVLGNHDQPRIASEKRAGAANARLAQMLLLTLRGTPTMYYGDELGMPNVAVPPERYRDVQALNEPGVGWSRDHVRTPMQWDASAQAGFSTVEPWLPIAKDDRTCNVVAQEADPQSMLSFVKRLILLRQQTPALRRGSYLELPVFERDVFAYLRTEGVESVLVVLNFSEREKIVNLSANSQKPQQILLSTQLDRAEQVSLNSLTLRPHEGLIIQMVF